MFHVQLAPLGGILGQNTPFERLIVFNVKTQKMRFLLIFLVYEVLLMSSITCQILQMDVSRVNILAQGRGDVGPSE